MPIRIVDQVRWEITKPENDPKGEVAEALKRLHNQVEVIETNVGVGFQARRGRDHRTPSGDLGEINGRLMPGHRPMRVAPETHALVRAVTRPASV